jgi:signal transduction histidine kinase
MVTRIAGRQTVGMTELIETSRQLSEKSEELQNTAKQLRIVNERLRTLDAQKDDFLSQVSHELRTPMTSNRSFSEILMNDPDISETDKARFVSIIQDESLRFTRLLDEILDISRLEAGMSQIKLMPMDANDAVKVAIDTVSGMTRTAGVSVKTDLDEGPVDILVNDDRLRQVMINVLSNAVKYNTASEPEIFVRTKRVNNSVLIDIIDNGGGVPADVSGSIFDKFTRDTHEGSNDGAGLGLAINLAIMRAMNGNLTLEHMPDKTNFFRLSLENPTANL